MNLIPYEYKNNQKIKLGTQEIRCSDFKVIVLFNDIISLWMI